MRVIYYITVFSIHHLSAEASLLKISKYTIEWTMNWYEDCLRYTLYIWVNNNLGGSHQIRTYRNREIVLTFRMFSFFCFNIYNILNCKYVKELIDHRDRHE